MSPKGQHIELGIAEQNLFLLLGAAGLTPAMTGARLLPVGTVYDPFVNRGLDALIYACYQDARFLLVSTPSGLTLAPEGGQHQSINTPLIGMAADRLASFEPAHVDELAILLRHAFDHMQRPDGSAVWLRLSTRQLEQPERTLDPAGGDRGRALGGRRRRRARASRSAIRGRWRRRPRRRSPNCGGRTGRGAAGDDQPGPAACRLARRRCARGARASVRRNRISSACWRRLAPDAALVTVLDGHPATHAWLGAVRGQRVVPARAGSFRPERRHSGSVSRIWHRYRRDSGRVRAGAADRLGRRTIALNFLIDFRD